MQIKTICNTTSCMLERLLSKKQEITNDGEYAENRQCSRPVCENINWLEPLQKPGWSFLKKLKIELLYNPTIPHLSIQYIQRK